MVPPRVSCSRCAVDSPLLSICIRRQRTISSIASSTSTLHARMMRTSSLPHCSCIQLSLRTNLLVFSHTSLNHHMRQLHYLSKNEMQPFIWRQITEILAICECDRFIPPPSSYFATYPSSTTSHQPFPTRHFCTLSPLPFPSPLS